jgi:hypothetical protein
MESEKLYHMLYKTTCTVTGNFYIGVHSTKNLEDEYLGSGKVLWYSIQKHGRENHVREILEFYPDRETLRLKEAEFVNKEMLSDTKCMNLCYGGEGGGWTSEEQKRNGERGIEKQKKLRNNDSEWREAESYRNSEKVKKTHSEGKGKVPNWNGKRHSEHTIQAFREQRSITSKGSRNSQFGRVWIYNLDEKVTKPVQHTELQEYLLLGWKKGRKYSDTSPEGRGFEPRPEVERFLVAQW